ncbi:hypothetical protein, partial [Stenotrophomonas maltophilia]|uniref:hypothetical protein n=1 Tax=Stenotrophomonas maltophilia TaxID=40324 RepID=UPI001E50ABFF
MEVRSFIRDANPGQGNLPRRGDHPAAQSHRSVRKILFHANAEEGDLDLCDSARARCEQRHFRCDALHGLSVHFATTRYAPRVVCVTLRTMPGSLEQRRIGDVQQPGIRHPQ